jgi:hypothetical protein
VPDLSDWMSRRLEWWPEIGAGAGVAAGAVRGFLGGEGSVGLPAVAAVAALFASVAGVHWLTKRAYFDRHLEHYLAAQYSSGLLMFGIGMGMARDVIGTGTLSMPLFDLAYSLMLCGIAYSIVFVLIRRSIVREWYENDSDDED